MLSRPNTWTPERRKASADRLAARNRAKAKPRLPRVKETLEAKKARMAVQAKTMNGTPEMRAKRSESNRKRGTAMLHTPEARAKRAERRRGWVWSDEVKAKMSATRTKLMLSSDHSAKVPFSSPKQQGSKKFLRSSYELRFVEMLDAEPGVLWFRYEPFAIPYGVGKHTIIDFLVKLVSGEEVLVEIKAAWDLGRAQVKIEAARNFALESGRGFSVLTEHELFG